MKLCRLLVTEIWFIFVTFRSVKLANGDNELCWNNALKDCQIVAEFTFTSGVVTPIKIGCNSLNTEELLLLSYSNNKNDLFHKNFHNIKSVSMSGCYANGRETFGFEYIPDREAIQVAKLKNFRMTKITKTNFANMTSLRELVFFNNELNEIDKSTFRNLKSLQSLYFRDNRIEYLENGLFDKIPKLRNLTIVEKKLVIHEGNLFIFANTSCVDLTLSMRKVNLKIFRLLPKKLQRLKVNGVNFSYERLYLLNPSNVSEAHITENSLATVTVEDTMTMELLNLSFNALRDFVFKNLTKLKMLDLRNNEIGFIRHDNLKGMESLEKLFLQNNKLKTLISEIFQPLPSLVFVDVSNNQLKAIRVHKGYSPNPDLKIRINKNPWSCVFLLELFAERADVYHTFIYDRFTGEINVNGIECVVYTVYTSFEDKTPFPSHLFKGYKIPRKHRSLEDRYMDVAIIVAILFAGVAVLSVILYLWIKCQKVFHLAFYRSIGHRRAGHEPIRTDSVRELPSSSGPRRLPSVKRVDYKDVEVSYDKVPSTVKIHDDKIKPKIPRTYRYDN